MILVIDHYDSFTWNLVHTLAVCRPGLRVGVDVVVARHDEIAAHRIATMHAGGPPTRIILSPGPCTPAEAEGSCEVVREYAGVVPILGVCLGQQCLAAAFGMRIARAPGPVHGKTSLARHDGQGVFRGLPDPVEVMRYHSLAVDEATIPGEGWRVSAWTGEGDSRVVMGLRRDFAEDGHAPLEGVQFHPESFMTPLGTRMIANFLDGTDVRTGPGPRTPCVCPSRAR